MPDTHSMGNQSPHRCFTVPMSSWQRRRRLTSLSALEGTTSVIHTCGGEETASPEGLLTRSTTTQEVGEGELASGFL